MTNIIKKNINQSHKYGRKAALELDTTADLNRVLADLTESRESIDRAIRNVKTAIKNGGGK